ncbi:MAG: glycogen/starch synthase [Candidatus Pacebacteria bacterium]|nr:glycogen/starch synthase [Candidatus Paceibacterota bacterium]
MPSSILKNFPPFKKPLKVLFVSAEVSPYVMVGGLGQVMKSLPAALRRSGVDARVFMPKYASIDEKKYPMEMIYEGLKVPTDDPEKKELICNVKKYTPAEPQAPTYFLENMEYYEKRANVYGYSDDPIRFALLCRGLLEFLQKSGWVPDIINATDWHTGFLPNYLKTKYSQDQKLSKINTVFSIHNLYHQGVFDHHTITELDFDDGRSDITPMFSERLAKQNFMKRGIIYSDAVNTVSETYSKEILTKDYGEGLDELLKEVRTKIYGILNGISYKDLNPATDKNIPFNFSLHDIKKRGKNKSNLQKEFNLEVSQDIPLIGMVTRLYEQKGIDLLFPIMEVLLSDFNLEFIIVGEGDAKYRDFFSNMAKKFPKRVGFHPISDFTLGRRVFAASDIFLMPSRFEPCGLTQIEAMRYGAIPIVRKTGGLADTVFDFDPRKNTGTGFVFEKYDSTALFGAIIRAIETFKHKTSWQGLVRRVMQADFSWEAAAKKYLSLYKKVISV